MRAAALAGLVAAACGGDRTTRPAKAPAATAQPVTDQPWTRFTPPPPMPRPSSSAASLVGDAVIYHATYGSGEPILLLHGGLGHGDLWGHQMPALAGKGQVIAIDTRGHGRSTMGSAPLSYTLMASDVVRVMDLMGLERAAIVGWSDGAIIGLHLAMHHPDRVSRVFAFGANVRFDALSHEEHAIIGRYVELAAADHTRLSEDPAAFERLAGAIGDLYRREPRYTREELGRIRIPVVIATGDHDELIPLEHAREIAASIPGARLVVLEGTSHFTPWQDPEAFNRAVLEFLGGR